MVVRGYGREEQVRMVRLAHATDPSPPHPTPPPPPDPHAPLSLPPPVTSHPLPAPYFCASLRRGGWVLSTDWNEQLGKQFVGHQHRQVSSCRPPVIRRLSTKRALNARLRGASGYSDTLSVARSSRRSVCLRMP